MSFWLLCLGFVLGMRHALDADHLAAVATLATRSRSLACTMRQVAIWGLGHAATLLLFGAAVLALDQVVPQRLALGLEAAVGVMLVFLGLDVIRRMVRDRVHIHAHRHRDGVLHIHAHSHAGKEEPRGEHDHTHGFPFRALFIGMMHGMAGTAALIVLALETARSPGAGLVYIALFGLGSIAGMALLSVAIALPLRYSAASLRWAYPGLQAAVALTSIVIGASLFCQIALGGAGR